MCEPPLALLTLLIIIHHFTKAAMDSDSEHPHNPFFQPFFQPFRNDIGDNMSFLNRMQRLSTVVNASVSSRLAATAPFLAPRASTRARKAEELVADVHEYSDLQYIHPVKTASLLVQGKSIELAFVDEYTGAQPAPETVVFLHGLGSYLPAWQKNIEALKPHYRCIALDMPGYGRTSKRSGDGSTYPYSMAFFAEVVIALMNALNLYRVTLCGHSMGGQISMTTALSFPERVKHLILVNSAGFEKFSPRELDLLRSSASARSVRDSSPAEIRATYKLNFFRMPPDAELMIAERVALRRARDFDDYCAAQEASIKAMVDGQVRDRLESITQPTLILFGENDALIPNPVIHSGTPRDVARAAAALIPDSKLVFIPRCGHFSQFERPELVNQEIIRFLE